MSESSKITIITRRNTFPEKLLSCNSVIINTNNVDRILFKESGIYIVFIDNKEEIFFAHIPFGKRVEEAERIRKWFKGEVFIVHDKQASNMLFRSKIKMFTTSGSITIINTHSTELIIGHKSDEEAKKLEKSYCVEFIETDI